MVDIQNEFDSLQQTLIRKVRDAEERYLLEVFGSYEIAKQVAHLYVLEPGPMTFEETPNADGNTYSIRYTVRVRPKRPEEIEAEQAASVSSGTLPKDLSDIHEWSWVDLDRNGHIECVCGYRPHNQEDMDEHIPPA